MVEHETKEQKREPYHLDTMKALLEKWETEHLNKILPKLANSEVGQLQAEMQQIAVRVSRKIQAALRNKCAACEKPLSELRGPYNTIPMYNINTSNWVNQYACSEKCSGVLQERARKAQEVLATSH